MFGIFKKTKECSVCGENSDTTKIIGLADPRKRGFENLCINCLREKWKYALEQYTGTALCFLPAKEFNAYSYIDVENALGNCATEEKDINIINNILNRYSEAQKCNECSGKGNFLFFNFPYWDDKTKEILLTIKKEEKPEPLCGKCFSQRILQEIENQNLLIDGIYTPYGEKGIYMQDQW